MNFNLEKCHILYVGNNNSKINYSQYVQLKNEVKETDLGAIVSTDLNFNAPR